jgi:SAM-dependent methyltransferase
VTMSRMARPLLTLADTARGRGSWRSTAGPDGMPLPPGRMLITTTGGNGQSPAWYWESGLHDHATIREVCHEAGHDPDGFSAVLDFGCGLGRIARHWLGQPGLEVYGCDYNRVVARWVQRNLTGVRIAKNQIKPPLPYRSDTFDLVYAYSVFTHFGEELQHQWLSEVRRILSPGGLLLASVFGESQLAPHHIPLAEQERFRRGEIVVARPMLTSSNACLAFLPPAWLDRNLPEGMSVVRRWAGEENRRMGTSHDFVLVGRQPEGPG